MFGVYMFGSDLERVWGPRRYLSYCVTCALSAAATQMGVASLTPAYYPTVGASGAVFGLLLAYALVFQSRTIISLFAPIPMRAPVFVAAYGALELVFGVTGLRRASHISRIWAAWPEAFCSCIFGKHGVDRTLPIFSAYTHRRALRL